MTIDTLHRIGLDERFGYKVKHDGEELCFIRYFHGAWRDVLTVPGPALTEEQALRLLGRFMRRGDLVVFGCCCLDCAVKPENRAALDELLASGVPAAIVSHGYWPEHMDAEIARAMQEPAIA